MRDPVLYRPRPTVVIVIIFLLLGSGAISTFHLGSRSGNTPREEVFIVYLALMHQGSWPDEMTRDYLSSALGAIDPDLQSIADRVEISDYARTDLLFSMKIRHTKEPDHVYTIDFHGVY